MPTIIQRVASAGPVDSLTQWRDLFVPTFTREKDRHMSSTAYRIVGATRASSSAGIGSAARSPRQQKRVDFLTRNCGLSLPTLFKRIGAMAAHGQPLPTSIYTTRLKRVRRPELAQRAGNPFAGPGVQAGSPVKTTPASIASGPAERLDNRIRMRVAKPSSGPTNKRVVRPPNRASPLSSSAFPNHQLSAANQ
jgi:hypothetical protein